MSDLGEYHARQQANAAQNALRAIRDIAVRHIGQKAKVKCERCHRTRSVDTASALGGGWPICCGLTMTLVVIPPTPTSSISNPTDLQENE